MKKLKEFVIQMLELLTGVTFVLIIVIGTLAGLAGGLIMGIVGLIMSFTLAVMISGIFYLLISINDRLGRLCGEKPHRFAALPVHRSKKISDGQGS